MIFGLSDLAPTLLYINMGLVPLQLLLNILLLQQFRNTGYGVLFGFCQHVDWILKMALMETARIGIGIGIGIGTLTRALLCNNHEAP